MRTTIAIDDELFAKAQEFAGLTEKSAVVREALKAFVERGLPIANCALRRSLAALWPRIVERYG